MWCSNGSASLRVIARNRLQRQGQCFGVDVSKSAKSVRRLSSMTGMSRSRGEVEQGRRGAPGPACEKPVPTTALAPPSTPPPQLAFADGTRIAYRSFVLSSLATFVLTGCLAQDLEYRVPPNWPPSIETPEAMGSGSSARRLDQIVRIRADQLGGGGDAGPITSLRFDVVVRDPDVAQELAYKVYVDFQRNVNEGAVIAEFLPPISRSLASRGQRSLSFNVPTSFLREPGCHRVELLVSGRFQTPGALTTGREPIEAGDLGTATWWVATQGGEGEAVDMTGCP